MLSTFRSPILRGSGVRPPRALPSGSAGQLRKSTRRRSQTDGESSNSRERTACVRGASRLRGHSTAHRLEQWSSVRRFVMNVCDVRTWREKYASKRLRRLVPYFLPLTRASWAPCTPVCPFATTASPRTRHPPARRRMRSSAPTDGAGVLRRDGRRRAPRERGVDVVALLSRAPHPQEPRVERVAGTVRVHDARDRARGRAPAPAVTAAGERRARRA